jgi:hypothetical protein
MLLMEPLPNTAILEYACAFVLQITEFHLSHQFDFRNGFHHPSPVNIGIGRRPLDVEGINYFSSVEPIR